MNKSWVAYKFILEKRNLVEEVHEFNNEINDESIFVFRFHCKIIYFYTNFDVEGLS